ncbi:GlcG/HbpS family heme-binding protein [Modestobacter sp. SYSU DS0290]
MLTLDQALELLAAARAEAEAIGVPMSFAVTDPGGHLVAVARMDGAPWITPEIAQGKAWTSVAFRVPTDVQKTRMEFMPNFVSALTALTGGRYTPQTGAVPVHADSALVGAIGAAGGTGAQDEAVCAAAVAACGYSVG